jgi:2-polyprenyl-3-methyl-5-hydroxy-6-metoxy-1,4-benzoquinol methylase
VTGPAELQLVETDCALCGSSVADVCARGEDFEYGTASNEFTFVRCRECRHVYLNPRPRVEDLDVIYPSNYYSFLGTQNPVVAKAQRKWESGKVALYREWIGDGHKRILDVGCGDGRFLTLLRDFGDPGWEGVGLEFDARAIAQCREQGFEAHAARVEDFAEDPAQRGRFDAVVMLQLIEHVEDPALLCERVHQLLKPGGIFVIETPNLAGLDHRLFEGRHWGHYHFPRHWHLFSQASLRRMLEDRGFEVVRAECLISTSSWIISHQNLLRDKGAPEWICRLVHFQNPILLGLAVVIDVVRTKLGRPTSNQRVIARTLGSAA